MEVAESLVWEGEVENTFFRGAKGDFLCVLSRSERRLFLRSFAERKATFSAFFRGAKDDYFERQIGSAVLSAAVANQRVVMVFCCV
jgi:hypothetical protein